MKIDRNKTTATAIALILMLTMAAFMMVIPAVQAITYPDFLIVSAEPNPVGVGQYLYINVFMSKPPPSGAGMGGDRYQNITMDVIDPDGVKTHFGPSQADPTGGVWYTFVPSKVGNYTVQAFYPGQVLTTSGFGTFAGAIMAPATSDKLTVVVQQAAIQGWRDVPLPTEYWSRPIYATNYAWSALGGNWFGLRAGVFANTGVYDAQGDEQLYSTAPNTGHIVWVKPTAFGGQVGAPMPGDQTYQYTATSILINSFEPIIINGVLYYNLYPTVNSVPQSWQAIDLRTGQPLSSFNTTAGLAGIERLRYGQVMGFHTAQEYGALPLLWSEGIAAALTAPPQTMRLYDPFSGEYLAQVYNCTDLALIADYSPDCMEPGTLLGWFTNGSSTAGTLSLNMWNSTRLLFYRNGFIKGVTSYSATIRPSGTYNWTNGVQWSVPIPTTLAGNIISPAMSIAARTMNPDGSGVILLRSSPSTMFVDISAGYQVTAGMDARTGALLWGPVNQTIPYLESFSMLAARDGVYVMHNKDRNEAYGYSLTSGQKLWGPVKLPGNAWGYITRGAEIAYGRIYIYDYGGNVNALDLKTGKIDWTVVPRSAGYATPYGVYPIWYYPMAVADGKIFLTEGKMYDPPLSPGCQMRVLNCTDGSLVWSELDYGGRMTAAVADGYLVNWNAYDKQVYCWGKGQTATTVDAPMIAVTIGSSVSIRGMVTDESPGTKDSTRTARFPHGVAAVSDASMSAWMEYVYMQQPYPTNCTGVEVTLDAYDPNGNFVHLGTATSDTSGFYSYNWQTPAVPGEYRIIATFAGSESYWPSYAETSAIVVEAAATPAPPQYPVPVDYTLPIVAATIVLLIAVAIATILMLRKRP